MKIFVDTNIFLDIALNRNQVKEGLAIFKAVKNSVFEGVIADITIINIDYIARKSQHNISTYLQAIEKNFSIKGANNAIIQKALDIDNSDLEDMVQYLLALESGCDCIVSNDKSFYRGEIGVLDSKEFVERFLR